LVLNFAKFRIHPSRKVYSTITGKLCCGFYCYSRLGISLPGPTSQNELNICVSPNQAFNNFFDKSGGLNVLRCGHNTHCPKKNSRNVQKTFHSNKMNFFLKMEKILNPFHNVYIKMVHSLWWMPIPFLGTVYRRTPYSRPNPHGRWTKRAILKTKISIWCLKLNIWLKI
jgi:hypothetical protein